MKHIFHPILGDTQYGDLHQNRALTEHIGVNRLMLHCEKLTIFHPFTLQRLEIVAPLDQQWQQLLARFGWSIKSTQN